MNNTVKLVLAVVVGLLLFGGIAWVGITANRNETNGGNGTSPSLNLNATQDSDVAATLTYTGKGFEPNTSIVKANSTLRVRNRSVRVLKFMSDPYGQNNSEPELNVGTLKPGESKTFYVSQKGIWGYHNALDPSEVGNITVR